MTRSILLKTVNAALLASFLVQAMTGLLLFFELSVLPGQMVGEIHEYNGLFFTSLVFLHIGLNWNWIRANFLAKIIRQK